MKTTKSKPSPASSVPAPVRQVVIKHDKSRRSYFVSYVKRAKGTRYTAAQFDERHNTLDFVKAWIAVHPNLELVGVCECEEFVPAPADSRESVIANAGDYTVINDGATRYAVETAALAAWEAKHGNISGDSYDDFCNAVPYVLPEIGTPGNAGQIELCADLLDNGAASRRF